MWIIYKLFRFTSAFLYRILDTGASTRLANSNIGIFIFHLLFGKKESIRVYETTEGIKIKLPLSDAFSFGLVHLGTISKYETAIVKKSLGKGDIVIDVGAYIDGWYSLLAGKLIGEKGQVYAFEPHPVYYKLLKENVKLNNLTNITVLKSGVSDRVGTFDFYEAGVASSLIESNVEVNIHEKIIAFKIKTTTLDKFVKEKKIKRIALIKIDVEGADMRVLRGAHRILQRTNAPDLIVEVADGFLRNAGSSEQELLNYLNQLGYQPFCFTQYGLKPYIFDPNLPQEKKPIVNLYFSKNSIRLSHLIKD